MKPRIEDVAKLANVSPTTVSRILNNRGYISAKTRENVYKAMTELNYHRNDLARSLFYNRTYIIGLIFPTTSNPFFGQLVFHIENICTSLGYKVMLCNSLNDINKEKQYLDMLQRNQVDGMIVGTHNQGISDYENSNLHFVAIDRYLSDKIPIVSSDNYEGGKIATQLLLNKGCKKIIHISGSNELKTPANMRKTAYEDLLRSVNRTPITYEVSDNFEENNHIEIVNKLFNENNNVDGIFACDDLTASIVINEARKRNINIPNDLKVIGYDGTDTVRSCLPQLTTIQQPIEEIADAAVNILIKQIDNTYNDINLQTILPVRLIEGTTT